MTCTRFFCADWATRTSQKFEFDDKHENTLSKCSIEVMENQQRQRNEINNLPDSVLIISHYFEVKNEAMKKMSDSISFRFSLER